MSIAASAVAELAIAQSSVAARGPHATPRRRQIKAIPDRLVAPEAR